MTETVVQSAVRRWRQRHGAMPAFDHDDAAQEARIGLWRAGSTMQTIAYRRIVDAVNGLHTGYRERSPLPLCDLDAAADQACNDYSPEQVAMARQAIARSPDVLTEWQMQVVTGLIDGVEPKDMAASKGVTVKAIADAWNRALANLRAAANGYRRG
jgi:DNA-directed RNA polymerase specialized sigma24 family protein